MCTQVVTGKLQQRFVASNIGVVYERIVSDLITLLPMLDAGGLDARYGLGGT